MHWLTIPAIHALVVNLVFASPLTRIPTNLNVTGGGVLEISKSLNNTSSTTLSVPRGREVRISENLYLIFYEFYGEVETQDGRALLEEVLIDATRERSVHDMNAPISHGRFEVDEPPLNFILSATPDGTPTYLETWYLARALHNYFPVPEHLGGPSKYWSFSFILRRQTQRAAWPASLAIATGLVI